jgi:uncharacterized protein YfaS (alpha-2-macroglobulin family)
MFTDRVLYLPNETVHIKAVVRNSKDLSIPKGEKVSLSISDPKGEEILNQELTINEFGSVSYPFLLNEEAPLGSYSVRLEYKNTSMNYG